MLPPHNGGIFKKESDLHDKKNVEAKRMKKQSLLAIIYSCVLILSLFTITASASMYTVRGYVYIDGELAPANVGVQLLFEDTVISDINGTSESGYYQIHFEASPTFMLECSLIVVYNGSEYVPIDNQTFYIWAGDETYGFEKDLPIDTVSNNAPDVPQLNSPSDESTIGSSSQATLSVDVFDEDGDVLDVTFYRGSDLEIGTVQVNSGESASVVWSGLSASTTYSWYAVADDGLSSTQSPTWSFTTGGENPPPPSPPNNPPNNPPQVFNSPPTADAGGPYTGTPDTDIVFDGSDSTDSDGTIENFSWDFGEGNVSFGPSPIFRYGFEGTYTVELTVTDDDGSTDSDIAEVLIVAANVPPAAPVISGPDFGSVNESLTFTVSATDADAEGLLFDFDWDDGQSDQSGPVPSGNDSSASHMWSVAGVYTIEVTASDNETSSAPSSKVVAIDAIILYHNETEIGYVTDDDGDGVFDTFHGDESSALGLMDSMYLVDVDGDGTYDVGFNETAPPPTVDVEDYEAEDVAEEADYTWLYVIIILLILVLLLLYLRRESNEEEKSDDSKSAKDAPKAAAAKKSSSQKKSGSKKK